MARRHFILATAGHVDHGKSALVTALTKADPDRLPEEKERGITIDLGFAELRLESVAEPSTELRVGIIDVPGHEDFVKNMVAGVGCVDVGLIVVAADDGWMPQTEEHFQILEYLGVKQLVIALNKIDLAEGDEDFLREVIKDELSETAFAEGPIVATSTTAGRGISELKQVLASVLDQLSDPADIDKPRLSVDRVFSVKGHGTVVTGSLMDGRLEVNQMVIVQPQGLSSRVRTLQCFGQAVEAASPGTRVAINLASVAVRSESGSGQEGVGRGDVITSEGFGLATRVIDCVFTKSKRLIGGSTPASKPLKHGARVRLHHGSANAPGRVFFLDRSKLEAGASAVGELRIERDVMVLTGDRFVIRDWPEMHTLAGGVVLEALADASRFRSDAQRRYLKASREGPTDLAILMKAQVDRDKVVAEAALLRGSRFGASAITDLVSSLERDGTIIRRRGMVFDRVYWEAQLDLASQTVQDFHCEHPELFGMPLAQLRSRLDRRLETCGAKGIIVAALAESGFIVESAVIRRSGHTISLPPKLRGSVDRIRKALGEKAEEPPPRKQMIVSADDEKAMRFLTDSGEAIEISGELVLLRSGYEKLYQAIRGFLQQCGGASVSELRRHTGVSRRIMLPLLEYLDAKAVTVRDGDLRRLKEWRTDRMEGPGSGIPSSRTAS
ncbi:MAG: Selenocysteine-specific elongation factor [Verrucomicrobia subdivision 3 bacterium]|nr:Selenocysteine-specific elongation factor [Limisphaerales bacterium]MCS1413406.1 Selenocysteine-specific elongation factor [Limisphaerales bacterium]